MNKLAQKRKCRGVILSDWGLQRFQEAVERSAITKNGGYAYTLEQLSNLRGIYPGFGIIISINDRTSTDTIKFIYVSQS
jgi:hypothetical protein